MAENSNMMMKVIIGIVIVVVLVLIFRGMSKGGIPGIPTPGAPAGQPSAPEQPAPTAAQGPTAAPLVPATTAAEQIGSKGLTLVDNVRCDLNARTVSFKFTNTESKPLKIHTGELVQLTPNSEYNFVRIGVNGRWANTNWDRTIDCGGKLEFQPGESTDCTMGGVVLRHPDQANELTGMHGQNVLTASNMNAAYKAYNDLDYFMCA